MPDRYFSLDEYFNVVECSTCGLGFVNPRPTREEIANYYPKQFYDYFEGEQDLHKRRYEVEASYLEGITCRAGDKLLLDIGCANGAFPRFMHDLGWQVEGVEVSTTSRPIRDFLVFSVEFDKIPVYEPRYDAITAWAVLEHVHDPMAYFHKASLVLKPGGYFVFLVTNFRSISSRSLFREDVPRHLYFFTEDTIQQYLLKNQFKLVKIDYSSRVYAMHPLNWWRYYLKKYIKNRELVWKDIPLPREQFLAKYSLANNLFSNGYYLVKNPLAVIDRRLLAPLFGKYQQLVKSYGITTYLAVKEPIY